MLKAAATDGHRLARFTLPRPEGAEGMPDVIVPRKAVAELRKLLEEALDGNVEVDLFGQQDPFHARRRGRGGPDQQADRRHLPRLFARHSDRATTSCSSSIRRASTKASTASRPSPPRRPARSRWRSTPTRSRCRSPAPTTAPPPRKSRPTTAPTRSRSASTPITCKDILAQIDGDTVELHLADPGAPTLIRQDDKSPALYVLMPMRV